jgi:hypothetical protein
VPALRTRSNIKKPSSQFTLAVKDPAGFTALLPRLADRFTCFAIVRNPAAVLASWRSVDLALAEGHAHLAESLRPDLRSDLAAAPRRTARLATLLSWWFRQYRECLAPSHILRYEDIIASAGSELGRIIPAAASLRADLISGNGSYPRSRRFLSAVQPWLLASGAPWLAFYSADEVVAAVESCSA